MAASVGFIGGGRITRVILAGWKRAGCRPERVTVSDIDAAALDRLHTAHPGLVLAPGDNLAPAREEVVFLAVHPPALGTVLAELRGRLAGSSLVVSLAPKVTLAEIQDSLGGFARLARVIPNAPSIVGAGFNPVAFAPALGARDRQALARLLAPLGDMPEVPEAELEAYAVLTGMGPTYLWFQLYELLALAGDFGLDRRAADLALQRMVEGALRTMAESGLPPADVMDLVPVRPLAVHEDTVRAAYRSQLEAVFAKIRPAVAASHG